MITTPAAGWKSVQVRPMVGEHTLEIVLVGEAPEAGEAPMLNVVLPEQILAARKVAEGKAADIPKGAGDVAKANIRITGENRAINDADGAELIWIPAGTFRRGSEVKPAGSDEGPARDIYLDGYWIYKLPVTVASYRKFCEATGREIPQTWSQKPHWRADPSAPGDNFPMICNWFEADAYAKWAGGSLPTEAQWEKAARGTDGREYPWGNQWDPKRLSCMANTIDQFVGPFRPVGYFPEGASPYGVLDMAGNVWEWVNDWYMHTYYASAPDRNPTGPDYSNVKVVRGGNSLFDERFSRTTARMAIPPEVSDWTAIGFRLVVEAPGPGTNGP
jgi:formylglycine-generating enzyme required for sulfatase activity